MIEVKVGDKTFQVQDRINDHCSQYFINPLHWAIECDTNGLVTKAILTHHPDVINTYYIISQFHVPVLELLLTAGYIPNEEYFSRVTSHKKLEALRCLCRHKVIEKILSDINDDVVGYYCDKEETARVLVEYGYFSKEAEDTFIIIGKLRRNEPIYSGV